MQSQCKPNGEEIARYHHTITKRRARDTGEGKAENTTRQTKK